GWLQAVLSGPSAPAALTLAASAEAQPAGTHDATVTVTAAGGASHVLTVRLTVRPSFALTITGGGSGNGTITGPDGVDCTIVRGSASGSCQVRFASAAPVTLTAVPD